MLNKKIASRVFQSIKFSFQEYQSPRNFIGLSDKIKPELKLTLKTSPICSKIKFKSINKFSSLKKDFNQRQDDQNVRKLLKQKSSFTNSLFEQTLLRFHLLKIIDTEIKESKHKNVLKLIFLIRNFLILTLNLGPKLSVMNQIEFGQDYKIKSGKQIMKAQFQLISKLQIQYQKCSNQQNLSEQNPVTKKLSIAVSQFYLLAKALQLVSNEPQFSVEKCFKSHHTWRKRFDYFKQCLPYGVLSKSFKQAEIYLLLIQDNFKRLSLDNNIKKEIDYIFTNMMSLAENNEFLRSNQRLFDNEKVMKYFCEYREQHQNNFQDSNEQVLKEQISCLFSNPSISGMSKESYLTINQENQQEYMFHSRRRRLQVDFGFVQYGLALFYSKKYKKEQKVNILNKIKNKVLLQYEQREENLRLAKENESSEDKRIGKNVKHLVAYDFGEYMRSNKIYTWLIYRVEDQKD